VVVVKERRVLASASPWRIFLSVMGIIALEKKLAEISLAGATIYTDLEPCPSRNIRGSCAIVWWERKVRSGRECILDTDSRPRGILALCRSTASELGKNAFNECALGAMFV